MDVRPDQRHVGALREREDAVVLQQNRPADGDPLRQGTVSGRVDGPGVPSGVVEQAEALHRAEDALDHVVEARPGDGPGFDRLGERFAEQTTPGYVGHAGHLEIEAPGRRADGALGPVPVRHDEPLEPPLSPQDLGDEPAVVAHVGPVDAVVRGHHGSGSGLNRPAERTEVELP